MPYKSVVVDGREYELSGDKGAWDLIDAEPKIGLYGKLIKTTRGKWEAFSWHSYKRAEFKKRRPAMRWLLDQSAARTEEQHSD